MKKILTVFGTRPEAIKMCPLVLKLKEKGFPVSVCVTGQHRQMLDAVLKSFGITPDFDLDVMRKGQTLCDITERILRGMTELLSGISPDIVLVHGDTSSAFAAALACFYLGIPIGHIEAGLRSGDMLSPFPEEFNRRAVSLMARYHFAPTERARENLLGEGVSEKNIFVTGNTVIDALKMTVKESFSHPIIDFAGGRRLVIFTAHRRESLGEGMENMLSALKKLSEGFADIAFFFPMHKNPKVREIAVKTLSDRKNVLLAEPPDAFDFHNLLARCYLVLTDSGGIQEEACALGKPTLVMRSVTERGEGIESGGLMLVGRDGDKIFSKASRLLTDFAAYNAMKNAPCPYGDGTACEKIAEILEKIL